MHSSPRISTRPAFDDAEFAALLAGWQHGTRLRRPDAFVAAVVLLGVLSVTLTSAGGRGRAAELILLFGAVAYAYSGRAHVARLGAVASVLAYGLVERRYGRLVRDEYWTHVVVLLSFGWAFLAAEWQRRIADVREARFAALGERAALRAEREASPLVVGDRAGSSLAVELDRARRHNHRVSVILLEPDRQDDAVDVYGVDAREQMLRVVAEAIGEHARTSDVAFRRDATSFCLVLPETDAAGARVLAERVRLAVVARQLAADGPQRSLPSTVSAGIATFPEDALTNDELVAAVEAALAEARGGGNRTLLHSLPTGAPAGWALERRDGHAP